MPTPDPKAVKVFAENDANKTASDNTTERKCEHKILQIEKCFRGGLGKIVKRHTASPPSGTQKIEGIIKAKDFSDVKCAAVKSVGGPQVAPLAAAGEMTLERLPYIFLFKRRRIIDELVCSRISFIYDFSIVGVCKSEGTCVRQRNGGGFSIVAGTPGTFFSSGIFQMDRGW
jgi:hypothetical protein